MMASKLSHGRALRVGLLLYAALALADTLLTMRGMGGDLQLEGNPLMRRVMELCGVGPGLLLEKAAVGAVTALIARYAAPAIRADAPWIHRVPSTRWARAWMAQKDRSWVAFIPLYAAAAFQGLAALSWLTLELLSQAMS